MADDQPTAPANRELAARIVAAYVRRNQVRFDQIPALISTVHQALAGLGKPESKDVGPRIPAVSFRQSVRPDYPMVAPAYSGAALAWQSNSA